MFFDRFLYFLANYFVSHHTYEYLKGWESTAESFLMGIASTNQPHTFITDLSNESITRVLHKNKNPSIKTFLCFTELCDKDLFLTSVFLIAINIPLIALFIIVIYNVFVVSGSSTDFYLHLIFSNSILQGLFSIKQCLTLI